MTVCRLLTQSSRWRLARARRQIPKHSWDGDYRIFLPPGTVTIRVLKDGYGPIEQSFVVAGHQTMDFELTPERPHENFEGRTR